MYAITWNPDAAHACAADWTHVWGLPYTATRDAAGAWHVGINLTKQGAA